MLPLFFPTLWPNFGQIARARWGSGSGSVSESGSLSRHVKRKTLVTLPGKGRGKSRRGREDEDEVGGETVTAAEQDRMKGQKKWKRETESHKTESAANCGSCNILCCFFVSFFFIIFFRCRFSFSLFLLCLAVGLLPFFIEGTATCNKEEEELMRSREGESEGNCSTQIAVDKIIRL